MASGLLINQDEYKDCFTNSCMYGTNGWPHRTVLLYKYKLKHFDCITKNRDILCNSEWKRCDNHENHAEITMLNEIEDWVGQRLFDRISDEKTFVLKIYASYSPCSDCSEKLKLFINQMTWADGFGDVEVKIRFQSFYLFPMTWKGGIPNIDFDSRHKLHKNLKGILDLIALDEEGRIELALIPDRGFNYNKFLHSIGILKRDRKTWIVPAPQELIAKNNVTRRWMKQLREYQENPIPEMAMASISSS